MTHNNNKNNMKKKKFPIPENIIEPLFGVGASVVIIGALMKITHFNSDFISANTMLTIGLVTEAVIFLIAGFRGYVLLSEDTAAAVTEDATDLSDIAAEADALKAAYQNATSQLESLGTNLSSAVRATGTLEVPADLPDNMTRMNSNVAQTNQALEQLSAAYNATTDAVATEPKAHREVVANRNALHAELATMKNTIADLNAKYTDILGAMKN
jgi:gliding motility-associated protein GldL